MLSSFPSPVLAVTADAVRDLEGGEALSGLWNLFTKCKESLQDGRRLENISWRLWYREMAGTASRPPTPVSPPAQFYQPPSPLSSHASDNASLRLGAAPRSVGKIICDIVPSDVLSPSAGLVREPAASLPTPATERDALIPTLHVPTATPTTPPRVVVVNPTPGPSPHPTPHPTPPTTPTAARSSPPSPVQSLSMHLLPTAALVVVATTARPRPTPVARDAPAPSPASARFFLKSSPDDAESPERGSSSGGSAHGQDGSPPRSQAHLQAHLQLQLQPLAPPPSMPWQLQPQPQLLSHWQPQSHQQPQSQQPSHPPQPSQPHPPPPPPSYSQPQPQPQPPSPSPPALPAPPTQQETKSASTSAGKARRAPALTRRDAKARATFNIGSSSTRTGPSDTASSRGAGTRVVVSGMTRLRPSPPRAPAPAPAPPAASSTKPKRTVVLTSSECETDSDDWSSESDDGSDAARGKRPAPPKEDPAAAAARRAAEEEARQRALFAKVPKRSYSNLNRTRSGLLSQLLHPDPGLLPAHRTSYSSGDFAALARGTAGLAPRGLATSKSAAALPQVSLGSGADAPLAGSSSRPPSKTAANGYRPKGRPAGQEMEDSDTGDDPDDAIQLSRSVAQQKLAALAGRRASAGAPPPPVASPSEARLHRLLQDPRAVLPTIPATPAAPTPTPAPAPAPAPAPLPLGHPYNLPPPTAPSTPRTTRRMMLHTEMSESLRRNLLWERQVSKTNVVGVGRRRRSAGVLGDGVRPLTSTPSMVQLVAKGAGQAAGQAAGEDERERRAGAVQRNRSWGNDYHYSGW